MSQEHLNGAVIKDNPFPNYCGIQIKSVSQDYCEAETTLVPDLCNPFGFAHGGLLMTLADCCASTACRTDGGKYVTLDSNFHFIKNTKEGTITATASIVNRGKTICISHVQIHDSQKRLLCDGTMTMFRVQ